MINALVKVQEKDNASGSRKWGTEKFNLESCVRLKRQTILCQTYEYKFIVCTLSAHYIIIPTRNVNISDVNTNACVGTSVFPTIISGTEIN